MLWKIEPIDGGWWLFYEGVKGVWLHTYHNKWYAVFPTLDAVFEKIKERETC